MPIKRHKAKQAPAPMDGESRSDFMDRCIGELMDEENMSESDARNECEVAWADQMTPPLMHKLHIDKSAGDALEFVLSDATPDRYGDIIEVEGWQLADFKRNPVALFSHDPKFVVGKWSNLRVEHKELRGGLELAPEGTSDRIDEIRRLVQAGILKAVSVGFKPLEHQPIDEKDPWGGTRYTKSELVETSLVAVPANPNALAVAKSLNISRATMDLVFAEHGKRTEETRAREYHAEHGNQRHANGRSRAMTPLAQRIQELEGRIVATQDELNAHWEKVDDTNVSDADLQRSNDLNARLATLTKQRENMVTSERILAGTSVSTSGGGNGQQRDLTVYQPPNNNGAGEQRTAIEVPYLIKSRGKEYDPLDYMIRAAVVAYAAKSWGKPIEEARLMIGRHFKVYEDDGTKGMCELVLRAASAPAMTSVVGWAAELVQQTWTDFMPLLMPKAVFNRLSARGLALSFGRAGKINIPTRARTPTIAGSFVGEGQPIPVRQGLFTTQALTPKKLAVITTWTREMDVYSTPAIEGLLRDAVQEDTTVAIDSVLLDANPATVVRPAGLLNGVAALTATAGGGLDAAIGDISQLVSALITSTLGNVRNPVWLLNPGDLHRLRMVIVSQSGVFPFRAEIDAGNLDGIAFIDSFTVPPRTLILIDAADFVTAGADAPRFEMSDQATLHEEDTAPAPIAPGPSGPASAPVRSLFQTDSLALRMIMNLNWTMRRSGMVAWVQNVTW
jgi:HK97 family phage prohead protease